MIFENYLSKLWFLFNNKPRVLTQILHRDASRFIRVIQDTNGGSYSPSGQNCRSFFYPHGCKVFPSYAFFLTLHYVLSPRRFYQGGKNSWRTLNSRLGTCEMGTDSEERGIDCLEGFFPSGLLTIAWTNSLGQKSFAGQDHLSYLTF